MRFTGRGFTQPVLSRSVVGGEARIRVDDNRNPEAWCELTLTGPELMDLFTQLGEAEDDEPDDPDATPLAPLEIENVPGTVLPAEGS